MKRLSSFRLKKKPGEKGSAAGDQKSEMPNSETNASSSSDTLRVPSDFRSIKQVFKKPFATLTQKSSSTSLESLGEPTMKGWLDKQGGVVKSWNTRWFILRGTQLYYYTNEEEGKQLGTISLEGNKVECLDSTEFGKFPFQIVPGGSRSRMTFTHETYQFLASSEKEQQAWVEAIKRATESIGGSPAVLRKDIDQAPAIFGTDLEEIMEYESKTSNRKVPQIVEQCVEYLLKYGLQTEGIFRLPGRTIIVKQLKEQFDNGERPMFTPPDMDVHSVASLLKMFLRDLPQPLVTLELYDIIMTLCTAGMQANPDAAIESLSNLLTKLPRHCYNILQYVCHFLDEVSQLESVNKMSAMNLATIFVGSIIRPNTDKPEELMGTLSARTMVVYLFVKKWREIFKVEYNNQGDLVQVDTLIDLGMNTNSLKKFKARTSVHPTNIPEGTASTLFDIDWTSDLMQPLTPVATPILPAPVDEETEVEEVYDVLKSSTNNLVEEFEINLNGKEQEEEEEAIYDTPEPRPSLIIPSSASAETDVQVTDTTDLSGEGEESKKYPPSEYFPTDSLQVPSTNQKRLSAPNLRPLVPPRPNKWRHTKQIGDGANRPRSKSHTLQSTFQKNPPDSNVTKPASSADNLNMMNSLSSITDSVTDSGHHGSESDSTGSHSPKDKSMGSTIQFDVLPLSSISTLGSSSGSQQSVGSDIQDVKLCEISSSDGSSFSLNDSNNQDEMLLGLVKRDHSEMNDSLHMSLSCGNKAAARRSRSSMMSVPTSPSSVSRFSVNSSIGESDSEKMESDDQFIKELTEKDVSDMSKDDLINHVSALSTELKVQRLKTKTLSSKMTAMKEKSTQKIQSLAKLLDKEKSSTANAVERIIKLQAQLEAYQLKFGEIDETVYGKTSFYH